MYPVIKESGNGPSDFNKPDIEPPVIRNAKYWYDAISAEKLFPVSLIGKVKATTVTVSNCSFDTG